MRSMQSVLLKMFPIKENDTTDFQTLHATYRQGNINMYFLKYVRQSH
jgi:hypothetical protein